MADVRPAAAWLPPRDSLLPADASPRSNDSAFSSDGDRVLAAVGAGLRPGGVPADAAADRGERPDGVGLPSSSARSVVDEALSASFHRAVECEKLITDILFDTNCKVTNSHRSQILGHLRQLVQECADMRAVAARQCGRADELRDQLAQARLAASTVLQPAASSGPADLTYAAVAHGGLRPAFPPGPGAAAGQAAMLPDAARAVAVGPQQRRDHAHVMFLTPLVPTGTAAEDIKHILKTNVDPARENLGAISVHKTPLGLTVLSDDLASVQKLKTLLERNPVTNTAMSVRLVQQRKPHVKLTGVDPDVPAVNLVAQINSRNPDLRLDPSTCEVRVSFRERSGNFTHVVAVDPPAYRSLMSRGRVSVGWTSAAVVEDVHVPTCTFCATYGHGRRSCPVRQHPERAVCTRCAGPHLGEQCTVRMGDAAVCCNECRRAGHPSSHPTGDKACPLLMARVARLRARTDYGVSSWRRGGVADRRAFFPVFISVFLLLSFFSLLGVIAPPSASFVPPFSFFLPGWAVWLGFVGLRPGLIGIAGWLVLFRCGRRHSLVRASHLSAPRSLPSAMADASPLRFLQANLANTRDATRLLVQHMVEGDFSFALVSDPHTHDHKIPHVPRNITVFHSREHPRVALLARAPTFDLFPIYVSQLIVAVSPASLPTFETPYARSWIDVTLASVSLASAGFTWQVSDRDNLSDHRYVEFTLFAATRRLERVLTNYARAQILESLRLHPWFERVHYASLTSGHALDSAVGHFYEIYEGLRRRNLRKAKPRGGKANAWWSPQLAEERLRVRAMRRRFKRARDPDLRSFYRTQYASAFAAYKQHIRRAKDAADRALCQDMTARNLYGSPFKLAFEKLHSATLLPPLETSPNVLTSSVLASASLLLSEHVATDDPGCDTPFHARLRTLACSDYPPVPDDHAFTLPEIEHALFQGNLRSAPGLDGLTGMFVRHLFRIHPSFFLLLFNAALRLGHFPTSWKEGRIIFIPKPGRPPHLPSAYRPIVMNSLFGKVLERLLNSRLYFFLNSNHLLHDSQFGFTHARSAPLALYVLKQRLLSLKASKTPAVLISLDFQGAFDSVWHAAVLFFLRRHRCPANLCHLLRSFLSGRRVVFRARAGESKTHQKQIMTKLIHASEASPQELLQTLRGLHFPAYPPDDHPDYTGSPNDLLDKPITEVKVRAEL
ncbi:hypothetical protein HPB49_008106 [Dermacentor silvarum]|uniref:Uncharacterized protein n=1 Tax=Dermacentor silvarum TaxID=543639 RepID=A0ACB8DXM8_DERSI|nr:hypothetical protein HPB49_008106 [Dermacentor silvarum]